MDPTLIGGQPPSPPMGAGTTRLQNRAKLIHTKRLTNYLLSELNHGDDNNKLIAAVRLGEVIYPDEEVVQGLQTLESGAPAGPVRHRSSRD